MKPREQRSLISDRCIVRNLIRDLLRHSRHVGYQNAGTVEFLLDDQGRHYFIEGN